MGESGNFNKLKETFDTKKVNSWREMLETTMKQIQEITGVLELELEKVEASLEDFSNEPLGDKVGKYKEIIKAIEILKSDLIDLEAAMKTLDESETKN